jgi:hypothetical protein
VSNQTHDDDDASEVVELAPPLRPGRAPDPAVVAHAAPAADEHATVAEPGPAVAFATRTGGPSRLRVGVVSGAAVALAVGAVATSLAATPPSPATATGTVPAAISQVPTALDPVLVPEDLELDHGRRGAGVVREITITAIDGSSVSLATDDGWTRTITVTDDTGLTRGGQDVALSDLAVGDQVRFRQERNDDGSYTVTDLAVVVPKVSGTISELTDTSFKVTTRDGSVWTITTDGSTAYRYGAADGSRADLDDGDRVLVQGETIGDNALTATTVTVAGDRVAGTVTAKTADTITLQTRDGESVTIHVSSDTEVRLPGIDDPGLDDIAVDMVIGVSGRERSDGSIDAAAVGAGRLGGHAGMPGKGLGRGGWDEAMPDQDD